MDLVAGVGASVGGFVCGCVVVKKGAFVRSTDGTCDGGGGGSTWREALVV